MYRNGIEMRVLVNGRPIREYPHNGMTFVESRHGSNYSIKIKNDNGFRVMAVVSVDGLDVITGKPAEKSNKGYIVDAYSSTEIKGYRISDNDSAAFVFVSKDKSYVANVSGDSRNSGVIGIRVFEEKPEKVKVVEKIVEKHHWHHDYPWNPYPWNPWKPYDPYPWKPYYHDPIWVCRSQSSDVTYGTGTGVNNLLSASTTNNPSVNYTNTNAGGANLKGVPTSNEDSGVQSSNAASGQLKGMSLSNSFDSPINYNEFDTGTSWGEKQNDRVKKEYFRKGKMVVELVVYYASTEALTNMGIDLTSTPKIAEATQVPKAFGNSQYCQPPKDWQG